MRESLAHIHFHELAYPSTNEELPFSANDNEKVVQPAETIAANDNEIGEVRAMAVPLETPDVEAEQLLSDTRVRLGLDISSVTEESPEEETVVPEEVPQMRPEQVQELIKEASVETAAERSQTETSSEGGETSTAESAGGASGNEGSGGDGSGKGRSSVETAAAEGGKREGSKQSKGIVKLLKGILWAPFVLITLAMTAIIKSTNKIFDSLKISKGGGGKPSGGSKPPAGGGGGGHH